MTVTSQFWAVVPAAGAGRRFGARVPKQYLDLGGRTVIDFCLRLFLASGRIRGIVVVLDPADMYWSATPLADDPDLMRADGGRERCHSVLNALELLAPQASEEDWILVHDAARPCLRAEDLDHLLDRVSAHPVGGLLGVPVRDTMKQAGAGGEVARTIPREGLWHAYTPQVFRFGLLHRALRTALERGQLVTDDAAAVELLGLAPLLVEGHADNIKITRPEDLPLARFYLAQQGRLC